jgi:hypothetical protein
MMNVEPHSQDRVAKDVALAALLDAHAEALVKGLPFEFTPEQTGLAALTPADSAEIYGLLHLAKRLSETLIPVLPSAEYVARLKGELTGDLTPALILRWRKLPASYRLAARLGGITLTAGLALLASRRMLGILSALNQGRAKADISLNTVP